MKKTIKKIAPAMLVLVALTTLSFMANEGIILRLRPQQDQTYTITSKANMMMRMEVQGMNMNQSQSIETKQSLAVKEVTDTTSTFETQIEAIKVTISQMGIKMVYDSEHPEKTSALLAGQTKEFEKVLKKPELVKYNLILQRIVMVE